MAGDLPPLVAQVLAQHPGVPTLESPLGTRGRCGRQPAGILRRLAQTEPRSVQGIRSVAALLAAACRRALEGLGAGVRGPAAAAAAAAALARVV
jgi:hypothetical protein